MTVSYDPFSTETRANPYPHYAELRQGAPVHRLEGTGFYLVSRYEDVLFVLKHPEFFSSKAMQRMIMSGMGVGIQNMDPSQAFDPKAVQVLAELSKSLGFNPVELMMTPSVIASDPPRHERLRGIVNRGFTPRRIAALEPRIRELASGCLDAAIRHGDLELVSGLSVPLPVTVIAEMLGVEPERRDQFKAWSDAFVIGLSGAAGQYSKDDVRRAADEMADYIERIAAERRASPKDDLISVLVRAEEGDTLTTGEVMSFVVLLLIAGNETTTNLIGNGVKALLAHPEQLARVLTDRSLVPALVDEALRYDSPVQALPRSTQSAVELPSGNVPANSVLLVFFASANHDEEQFRDAERFDIDRETPGHVAFGHGLHFCLGASLARLEARVAFEELFSRCRSLELAAGSVPMLDSLVLRGPKSLPLRVEAR